MDKQKIIGTALVIIFFFLIRYLFFTQEEDIGCNVLKEDELYGTIWEGPEGVRMQFNEKSSSGVIYFLGESIEFTYTLKYCLFRSIDDEYDEVMLEGEVVSFTNDSLIVHEEGGEVVFTKQKGKSSQNSN